jgi:hypothetical protein
MESFCVMENNNGATYEHFNLAFSPTAITDRPPDLEIRNST